MDILDFFSKDDLKSSSIYRLTPSLKLYFFSEKGTNKTIINIMCGRVSQRLSAKLELKTSGGIQGGAKVDLSCSYGKSYNN